jgi:hypothetical protein
MSAQTASLPELVRTLADDARELVKAEVGLAKDELKKTARVMLVAIAGATAATVIAVLAMCAFVAAGVLALGGSDAAAITAGAAWGAVLVIAAVLVAMRFLSKGQAAETATAPAVQESDPGLSNKQSEVL